MVIADRRPALVVLIGRISEGHFHGGRPVIGILGGAWAVQLLRCLLHRLDLPVLLHRGGENIRKPEIRHQRGLRSRDTFV